MIAPPSPADNPGTILASAVDAEVAKFRNLQQELQNLQANYQTVMGQQTENELVAAELDLIHNNDTVYKMIGPVLIKQDLEEARDTVQKRLEFIRSEKEKLEAKIESTEKAGNDRATKIQKMQAQLQQVTAQAVRAIAEEHNNTGT